MRVCIIGAGKVGRSLGRAIRANGWRVEVRPARKGLPRRPIVADLLVLAVRDRDLAPLAAELAARRLVGRATACVHVAGAVGPEALEPLRAVSAGVAQMHPMISFASRSFLPTLSRGNVRVRGDAPAVRKASALAKRLGMTPRALPGLEVVGYHAAAGLLANGAAALAAVAAELLVRSGVPRHEAPRLLGPLLRSVADNVERLGFPESLTGPVRRGDAAGVAKHMQLLGELLPDAVPLYRAAAIAQLPLARALSDAPGASFDAIDALLRTPPPRRGA
jgi:predicted short-subunit dehydrogenase-like oxidoreductase (DUF2520 family)